MKKSCLSIVAAALLTACNSSPVPSSAAESAASAAPSSATSSSSIASSATAATDDKASDCPHDGKWALCSIERRLKQSGFVVKRIEGDTARRAGFNGKRSAYSLGRSRLEVFLYNDSAAVARDVAKLDTLTAGPVGRPSQWGETAPTLIRSANLVAVILTQDARQLERAMLVLTAGPPQRGSPR